MDLSLHKIKIKKASKYMFKPIFDIDADFCENEERFRKDTLSLGYNSESERCSEELFNLYKDRLLSGKEIYLDVLLEAVDRVINYSTNNVQFIVSHPEYTSEYAFDLIEINKSDKEYVLILATTK